MDRSTLRLLGGVLIVAGLAALSFATTGLHCTPVTGTNMVSVDLSRLARGHGHSFCYTDDAGRKIRFVLARGADGKVHSVFDACRQCYTYHRGYALSGGYLICRVCGNRYPIEQMIKGKASCIPVSLPHREESGKVKIRVADLVEGHGFF